MTSTQRKQKLNAINLELEEGASLLSACARAGVSVAWYRRWHGRLEEAGLDGLGDLPRSGRPASVAVSDDDALKLRKAYLKSNRDGRHGSITLAARMLAKQKLLSPDLCESILKDRASKHSLPRDVVRACRASVAEVQRYRDVKSGQNDGQYTPGWLRMAEDGSRRLLPGERHVWDDATVNVGVIVPWSRGGDKCSDRYGVRVARFQLLMCLDCATDFGVGYSYVMHGNDAYDAADIVRAMHSVWDHAGYVPKVCVLEGSSWQAKRTLDFLRDAGVTLISAKGRPNQKLVECFFNRLWTVMSVELPSGGQVGRFRGEMAKENLDWSAVREGRRDPRGLFPTLEVFLAALDRSIAYLNAEKIESRTYGTWVPAEAYAGAAQNGQPMVAGLWQRALPVEEVRQMRRQGTVKIRCMSPFGFAHDYVFATEDGYRFDGAQVRVAFDPYNIDSGACISLAAPWQSHPVGTPIAVGARCISPAPDVLALGGALDPRMNASQIKKASRALVAESVASFDDRGRQKRQTIARGTSPKISILDYLGKKAAHVEEDAEAELALERASGTAAKATDWAKMEREAGIIA